MSQHALTAHEYQALVEQAPILIWRADLTKGCDYFNERWLDFTGRTMAQESGNGWAEGVHPDDLAECLKVYTTAFAKREVFEMEYRIKRHDGAWRWLLDRGVPFNDGKDEFAGYIGSCIDVSDRKAAQETLKAAQTHELKTLRALLPICASCKKIRDDDGYWEQIESYLRDHADIHFTHSLCPDCSRKFYGDLGVPYPQPNLRANRSGFPTCVGLKPTKSGADRAPLQQTMPSCRGWGMGGAGGCKDSAPVGAANRSHEPAAKRLQPPVESR
jgi:PAS domain S-box-containing protein